jgi:hypothetical protein
MHCGVNAALPGSPPGPDYNRIFDHEMMGAVQRIAGEIWTELTQSFPQIDAKNCSTNHFEQSCRCGGTNYMDEPPSEIDYEQKQEIIEGLGQHQLNQLLRRFPQ